MSTKIFNSSCIVVGLLQAIGGGWHAYSTHVSNDSHMLLIENIAAMSQSDGDTGSGPFKSVPCYWKKSENPKSRTYPICPEGTVAPGYSGGSAVVLDCPAQQRVDILSGYAYCVRELDF